MEEILYYMVVFAICAFMLLLAFRTIKALATGVHKSFYGFMNRKAAREGSPKRFWFQIAMDALVFTGLLIVLIALIIIL